MAESPSVHKDRVLACSVYCNGSKLKDEYALVSCYGASGTEPHWQSNIEV